MGQLGTLMAEFELKYVDRQRDRHGRVAYYYFRRNGRRWELHGEPLSERFMAEYRRLLLETDARPDVTHRTVYQRGTLGALVHEYLKSAVFKEKKPRTAAEYRRVLEALVEMYGPKPIRELRRRHCVGSATSAQTPQEPRTLSADAEARPQLRRR